MTQAAVLRNYSNPEEALVVSAALQDGGFAAEIDNINHVTLEWYLIPALGGVQVRVPDSQLAAARAYLNDMVESAYERLIAATGEIPEPAPRSRWRAWVGVALWFGLAEIIGLAIIWVLSAIIPPEWITDQHTISTYWGSGSTMLTSSHSPALGLVFLLVLALITWNELFEFDRAKKLRAIESETST